MRGGNGAFGARLVAGQWRSCFRQRLLGLGVARFFLGIGEGSCFPAATKGAVEWFPIDKRGLAIGIANGGSAFGAVIAPPLTTHLAGRFGWRGAFLTTGVLGLSWLVAWLAACQWASGNIPAERRAAAEPVSIGRLLGVSRVRWFLAARFLFDPVFYFYMFWIPKYLADERGFSQKQIGNYYWIPYLVLGISQIFSGRLSDLLVRRGWAPAQGPPRSAHHRCVGDARVLAGLAGPQRAVGSRADVVPHARPRTMDHKLSRAVERRIPIQ